MKRRGVLASLVTAAFGVLLGACSKTEATPSPAGSASAAPKPRPIVAPPAPEGPVTLTIGHDLWVGYSGVFIANDLGYFKEAGLDVKLKPFSNPGDTLPALVAGQLDVGLTTLQNLAVLNGNGDTDVVAVALLDSSNGADAVVAKKSIKSFADLTGKKVALTLGEVNHFLFLVGLKQNNVDPSGVQITSMSADDAGAAFVAGKVDAAVTWEPWVTKAKKSGGHVIFTSESTPDTIMDSVAVRRAKLETHASAYKKLLLAIDRGVSYLKAEPDQAAAVIGKYLDAPPADVKGMLSGDKIYSLDDNRQLFGNSRAPGPAYQSMKAVIDFALESKLIKKAPEAESLLDPALLE